MASTFTTTLLDPQNLPGSPQRLEVQGALSGGGLEIRAKGFGTSQSEMFFGTVARLEWFNGKLTLQVYVDSGGSKSTHSFDLQGVVETARRAAAVVLPMPASYYGVGDLVRMARIGGPDMWVGDDRDRFLGVTGKVWCVNKESDLGLFRGRIVIAFEHDGKKWGGVPFPPWNMDLVCRSEDIPPPPPPPPPPTGFEAVWMAIWNILTTPL